MRVGHVGRRADVVAVGLDERLPLAGLLIQPRELAVRAVVAAVDRDDLLERLRRAVELAERSSHAAAMRSYSDDALGVRRRCVELRPRGPRGTSRSARSSRRAARARAAPSGSADRDRGPAGTRRSTGRRRRAADVPDLTDLEPELDDACSSSSTVGAPRQHVDQRLPLLGAAVQPVERDERRCALRRGRAPAGTRGSRRRRPASGARAARRAGCRGRSSSRRRARRPAWRCSVSISSLQLPRLRCRSAIAGSAPVCAGSMRSACCTEWIAYSRWREVLAVPAADLHPQVRGRAAISRSSSLTRLRVLVEQLLPAVGRRGEALELARASDRASSRA